jgi:hypothetical protein
MGMHGFPPGGMPGMPGGMPGMPGGFPGGPGGGMPGMHGGMSPYGGGQMGGPGGQQAGLVEYRYHSSPRYYCVRSKKHSTDDIQYAPCDVALQVAFERRILKPVFHLIGFRLWV